MRRTLKLHMTLFRWKYQLKRVGSMVIKFVACQTFNKDALQGSNPILLMCKHIFYEDNSRYSIVSWEYLIWPYTSVGNNIGKNEWNEYMNRNTVSTENFKSIENICDEHVLSPALEPVTRQYFETFSHISNYECFMLIIHLSVYKVIQRTSCINFI